jgi:hypothetical protein
MPKYIVILRYILNKLDVSTKVLYLTSFTYLINGETDHLLFLSRKMRDVHIDNYFLGLSSYLAENRVCLHYKGQSYKHSRSSCKVSVSFVGF